MACSSLISYACMCRWTGSLYFSDLAKTEKSRQKFAKNIAKLVKKYDLDGVNLDWGKLILILRDRHLLTIAQLHIQSIPTALTASLVMQSN